MDNDIIEGAPPKDGIGLCLSGGGYRAMLFHVGAMWRLMDSGKLLDITRFSSVSGGSITAGVLALAWDGLASGGMATFQREVVAPLRAMARITIDAQSILGGIVLSGSIGQYVAKAYAQHLFGEKTLQDLPKSATFIFNATNLETGSLFRFSKRDARDWRVGTIVAPDIKIADAVAASSAFPPLLSPFILNVDPEDFEVPRSGEVGNDAYREDISLTDGGVYDNLGLEQIWKKCRTVLVSDAGGKLVDDASPPGDWARQSARVMEILDHQVRNLRKIQVIGSLARKERLGAYWGIRTDISNYGLSSALPCPHVQTMRIAEIATRLRKMDNHQQEMLINWGYAVTDAGLRSHWDPNLLAPTGFPYPLTGIG